MAQLVRTSPSDLYYVECHRSYLLLFIYTIYLELYEFALLFY